MEFFEPLILLLAVAIFITKTFFPFSIIHISENVKKSITIAIIVVIVFIPVLSTGSENGMHILNMSIQFPSYISYLAIPIISLCLFKSNKKDNEKKIFKFLSFLSALLLPFIVSSILFWLKYKYLKYIFEKEDGFDLVIYNPAMSFTVAMIFFILDRAFPKK